MGEGARAEELTHDCSAALGPADADDGLSISDELEESLFNFWQFFFFCAKRDADDFPSGRGEGKRRGTDVNDYAAIKLVSSLQNHCPRRRDGEVPGVVGGAT